MAGLAQLALFAYATAPGLAGTSDSRLYLHAAQTLRATGHLLNPDGTPYRYWPPLYPALLAVAGGLARVRVLHALCLLGSLLLWAWVGRKLLSPGRARVLPLLLALSTPWLLVGKFVWAESVFLLLFAAYAALLWQWLQAGRWQWWAAATVAGGLLPLQRTLGLFLLAGVGAGLLLGEWRRLEGHRRGQLLLHLAISASGGVLWQWYALLVAGPSRYHPALGWGKLLSALADYGFVLSRWLLPLPTAGRAAVPHAVWAVVLLALFALLWPRQARVSRAGVETPEKAATPETSEPALLLRRTLWSTALVLVALVAGLTVFGQSAAGIHDTERYASVLVAPIALLVLAAWPEQALRWLSRVLLAGWLLGTALRTGHVAHDLRRVPPLAPASFAGPGPHGQRVGAAGEEGGNGFAKLRMHQRAGNFGQWHQRKPPRCQPGVGHGQVGRGNDFFAKQQNVYVQRAAAPALVALTAGCLLGGQAGGQQLSGR
ncbi:hypothetical protein GCM10027345_04260 [Hymenobacter daeguensis]